jgi:predicted transcriptional regulator
MKKAKENRRTFRLNDDVMKKLDEVAKVYFSGKERCRTQALIYLIEEEYKTIKELKGT